jgi:outer membrane protein
MRPDARLLVIAGGLALGIPALPEDASSPAAGVSVQAGAAQPAPAATAQPEAAAPMSLEEAIAYAVRNNPRVAGAAAAVRAARARVTQRRAVRLPQLGNNAFIQYSGPQDSTGGFGGFGSGGNTGGNNGGNGGGNNGGGGGNNGGGNGGGGSFGGFSQSPWRWDVGVALSQVIFDWGQRSALQRAAERDVRATEFQRAETENDIRLVVGTTFYNILRSQQLVQVARERVTSATEQLRVARLRFETDVAPRFDVIRAEAELANAQQELTQSQNAVALSEAAFNTALGRDVTTAVALQLSGVNDRADVPFEQLREAALRQRPQLHALRETIEAGQQIVRARRAENKPQISLNSGYDRFSTFSSTSPPDRYTAGLFMTFPFFDSGLTRGRVREAQANVSGTAAELERIRLQVELDVRQAQLELQEARQRIGTAEAELTAAREALRVAEVRYRSGVGTTIEVTDAQLAVARAGQNVADARFDYYTAGVRLDTAIGAPVPGAPPRPVPAGSRTLPPAAPAAGTPPAAAPR